MSQFLLVFFNKIFQINSRAWFWKNFYNVFIFTLARLLVRILGLSLDLWTEFRELSANKRTLQDIGYWCCDECAFAGYKEILVPQNCFPPNLVFLSRVSSFLLWLIFKTVWLDAVMSGASSELPEKSFRSGFWTTLFGPCHDNPVIDLVALSFLDIMTLSIAFKIASWIQFLTLTTTSTFFRTLSAKHFFSDSGMILVVSITGDARLWS